jgi:hypothetical protein
VLDSQSTTYYSGNEKNHSPDEILNTKLQRRCHFYKNLPHEVAGE